MDKNNKRVLVLDAHSRSATVAILSLVRSGHEVHAAGDEGSIGFLVKGTTQRYVQPAIDLTGGYIAWLRELDTKHNYDLIVPSTEESLTAFVALAEDDVLKKKAVLAPQSALETALSKKATLELAARLGIPCPAPLWRSAQTPGVRSAISAARQRAPGAVAADRRGFARGIHTR